MCQFINLTKFVYDSLVTLVFLGTQILEPWMNYLTCYFWLQNLFFSLYCRQTTTMDWLQWALDFAGKLYWKYFFPLHDLWFFKKFQFFIFFWIFKPSILLHYLHAKLFYLYFFPLHVLRFFKKILLLILCTVSRTI